MSSEREMTLDEYVGQLLEFHSARRELKALRDDQGRYKGMVEPKYPLIADCAKCRDCGDPVHDFLVSQELWDQVIGSEGVWCWDCFSERADQKGMELLLPVVLTVEEVDAVVAIHPHIFGKQ